MVHTASTDPYRLFIYCFKKSNKKVQINESSDSESSSPLSHWKYLFDDGNDRFSNNNNSIANIIRPKSEPCLSTALALENNSNNQTPSVKSVKKSKALKSKTILGYDWITG